jgi:hypothetical protein
MQSTTYNIRQVMTMSETEVRDLYCRRYRVGTRDRDVLGYSRTWVLAAGWLAMLSVSANQYGYGVLAPRLAESHGWSVTPVLWGLALWGACHSLTAGALLWLRPRMRLPPGPAAAVGAALCALGLLALGHISIPVVALTGYGLCSGVGTGLVYRTCLATVTGWYPDRPVRVAAVSGAFAYGSIPLVLVGATVSDLPMAVDKAAFGMLVAVLACAAVLREPPAHWWPAHLDPRRWAVDRAVNPGLRHERPAIRQHSTAEVLRCPVSWTMSALTICVSAVALFDTGFLVLYGIAGGWSIRTAVWPLVAFALGSGGVRATAVWAAGRVGRRLVVRSAFLLGAIAQLGLLGAHHLLVPMLLAGCAAGAAIGTWYALFPGLVRSHFGDRPGLPNLWLVYSAKAVGSLAGVGGGLLMVLNQGYSTALAISAALCLLGAGLVRLLYQPGMPRTLPHAYPTSIRS